METFTRVATMLESELASSVSQSQAPKQKQEKPQNRMPPTSHTLMDLIITISIYLPRTAFPNLFTAASLIINSDTDPQLQKKAYKLIPRLAESGSGATALRERSTELQTLLLSSAAKTSAPAKRDRLAALATLISFLPQTDLHFIPAILSEVVIACKEVNEKARTAAFDLLVAMGEKMAEGGTVVQNKVPHMPSDAPPVAASLEEYFTMVSAGLAGSTPHMISASITALTRILYGFHARLKEETVVDLVKTMDLFLTSNNREIVRSVLGFVKVSVIGLPSGLMLPRLGSMIGNLMVWSHEHKAHFRSKVKHILERMIRRFGLEIVEKNVPEADKKLIANIRKTRERRKRKRDAAADGEEGAEADKERRKGRFESEFDEAVYGSADEMEGSEDEGSDFSDDEVLGRKGKRGQKGGETYILEDEDEPLDLLSRKALGNISTTKPVKARQPPKEKSKAKVDIDGKLILRDDDEEDEDMLDLEAGGEPGDGTLEGGINAYVDAIRGRDAAVRGQRGRLKFSNKGKGREEDMEVDEEEVRSKVKAQTAQRGRGGGRGGFKSQRRGLGVEKTRDGMDRGRGGMDRTRGGRIGKSPRGRGRGRGGRR